MTATGEVVEVAAGKLGRPTWRRARLWLVLAAVILAGALFVDAFTSQPGAPLDPRSADHDGGKALAVLLAGRGTTTTRTSSLASAVDAARSATVLLAFPDDLSTAQLTDLVDSGHRLVVVDPDPAALAALAPTIQSVDVADPDPIEPGCSWPGAATTGAVQFPDLTNTYDAPSPAYTCYDGAVVVTDSLVLLGSADLLQNDHLAGNDIAALDINAISADGTVAQVTWLMPGVQDAGTGSPTVWDLFPPFVHRAFLWLLVVGALLLLWRGRRLGPVVSEPLPVIVRSAEVVEGHGRLYRRASARAKAAAVLRAATSARLAAQLGLARGAPATEVTAVLGTRGHDGPQVAGALLGSVPTDDQSLVRLANELAAVEADVHESPRATGPDWSANSSGGSDGRA
jgi:hypothetical protein